MPIEIEQEANRTRWRARVEPPLLIGLIPTEVPRSATQLIPLLRRTAESSFDGERARAVIKKAFDLAHGAPNAWTVLVSDTEIEISAPAGASELELERGRALLQALLDGIAALSRTLPLPPWRQGVLDAWTAAARELGAELDEDALVLVHQRAAARAEVSLAFESSALCTVVRVPRTLGKLASVEASDALALLSELECEVRESDEALVVVRAGLIASAPALREILEAVVALALGQRGDHDPYRGGTKRS